MPLANDHYKMIRLEVPRDFIVPSFFNASDSHPNKVALALRLGAEAALFMQKKAVESVRQETHAEAIAEAEAEWKTELEKMAGTAEKTQAKLRAEKMELTARLEALEAAAAEVRAAAQREAKASFEGVVASKDAQIKQLQATLEKQMEAVAARVEGLRNSMTKTFTSSKEKGSFGEGLVETFLKKAFDCDVAIISKESQTADIRMTRTAGAGATHSYFWEAKNYTRMVSSEEVEKFRRDLRLHPDVRGGILVSLRTGIVGKSRGGDVDVEFLEDGRFILFVSNLMARDDPVFYLQSLRPLFDTVEQMSRPFKAEEESVRALEAKAALVSTLLRSHSMGIARHKNALLGHRKRMDTMFSEFQGYLMEAEAQVQTLLRAAMGSETEQETVATEAETALSAVVFRKERMADLEERQKEFVKWLLGAATVQEGTQTEVKDLVEAARGAGFSEKWIRGVRESLFQESAWPKGARTMFGLQLRAANKIVESGRP